MSPFIRIIVQIPESRKIAKFRCMLRLSGMADANPGRQGRAKKL